MQIYLKTQMKFSGKIQYARNDPGRARSLTKPIPIEKTEVECSPQKVLWKDGFTGKYYQTFKD